MDWFLYDKGLRHKRVKMERFPKIIMPECRCATRNFSGQGRGGRIWHFHKHFVKTQEKEDPQGNILDFPFLPSGVPVSVAEYV